ncbi:MAG TPA: Rne/Rng family ribonuclease [Actinomycetota bacterium]
MSEEHEAQATTSVGVAEAGAGGGSGPEGDGAAATPRRRRRRRGGRGRGGRAGTGAATSTTTSTTTPAPPAQDGASKTTKSATSRRSSGATKSATKAEATAAAGEAQDAAPAPSEGSAASARGRTRTRGTTRSRTTKPKASDEGAAAQADATAATTAADGDGEAPSAPRRRRRRGGRGRSRAGSSAAVTAEAAAADGDGSAEPATATKAEAAPKSKPAAKAEPAKRGDEAPAKPARRTRSRAKSTKAAAPAAETETADEAEAPARGRGSRLDATRTRKRRLPGRRRREPVAAITRAADKTMLITELDERDQIAVLQDRLLVEHYITRSGARSMVGNIYLGKVQNVLPGMEAAFIDLGRGRNAVLYAGEVSYDEEIDGQARRIEHVLKSGQNVIVQVTKDPIGGKGARLTQEISLPGRYVVFVPKSQTFGISRRLPDAERSRLKEILKKIRPAGDGLIVRTAADGAPAEDLTTDLERLIEEWAVIEKSAKRGRAPRVLYEEPELTIRVVRDLFTEGEFKEIVTDSPRIFELVTGYLQGVAPDLVDKVRLHEGKLPVMEAFHVTEQVHKALDRKVWLPSGGYIVIDRTEAMTVIDVNTGKHVGKANLEETVTKTNLEAAEEIARQLRLRDIGGMIIVDFIDMLLERNKDKVIQTMKGAMALDKTRAQVFDEISPLGLLEITRKRVSAGLLESFSHTCPECEGRGIIIDHKI